MSLGIKVDWLRMETLFLSALMTSIVVSFMGIIAFIGFARSAHRQDVPGKRS